jgi:hypothetical protein
MFNAFRKPRPHQPTARLAQALASDGLPPGMDPSTLALVEIGPPTPMTSTSSSMTNPNEV